MEPVKKGEPARFVQWVDAIFADKELRDIAAKGYFDIRLVAIRISRGGDYGIECYPAAETVADDIGCQYKAIERYRTMLIDLGWFTVVRRDGGRNRRALVLDISLPNEANGNGQTTAET